MDPVFLPHVFERFRQADGTVSRQHGGLGLGLAIVRHLVELHGGMVYADSPGAGQGSTFTVDLPRVHPEQLAAPSQRSSEPAGSRSRAEDSPTLHWCHALVVDDDDDTRDLTRAILAAAGATVKVTSSVPEALRHLQQSAFDVLLADIGMPGIDGYAFIRAVRESEAGTDRHLPAAAITAYAENLDRERALAAGFDCHVPKPITPTGIVEAILSLCNRADETS